MVRHAAGAEPEVMRAEARTGPANVDVFMSAELRFPGDIPATVDCAMEAAQRFSAGLRVRGERGELRVRNPLSPHFGHELRIETADGTSAETLEGDTTYLCQLRAFVDHVLRGTPVPTGPADAIANMRTIDAIYTAAGLPRRGT